MGKYIFKRFLMLIPVIIGVSLMIFVMLDLAPGNVLDIIANDYTPEQLEELKHQLGYDRSVFYRRFAEAYPDVIYKTERITKRMEELRAETERLRQEAEKRRVAAFKNAQPGDKVYYSQDYEWSSGGWFFRSSGRYSMRIICFVEQNVNEGERLQIRVGSVESTDRDRYSTPVIDGIEYRKGDVIWIKPLYDSKWHIEGE